MNNTQYQKDLFAGVYYNVLQKLDFCKTSSDKLYQIKKNLPDMLVSKLDKEIASMFMNKLSLLIYNSPEVLPGYEVNNVIDLFPVTTKLFLTTCQINDHDYLTLNFDTETIQLLKQYVSEDDTTFKLIENHISMICKAYNSKYGTDTKFII